MRVSPRGDTVVAGRAEPGARVAVLDHGAEIGSTRADAGGQFVVVPDRPLAAGARELTLGSQLRDAPVVTSTTPVLVVVPDRTTPPTAAGLPEAIALLAPAGGPPRLLQAPPAPDDASRSARFGLDVIDYGEQGAIHFAGNAPAGDTVRLYVDNSAMGDGVADAARRWVVTPTAEVSPGQHRVRADLLASGADTPARVSARVELPFERATRVRAELAATSIVVQPSHSLWRIARQVYGDGLRYTLIYRANKDQIRKPDLIYPGQVFGLPR